jgi:DNA-directed RNA polymerase subunit L
MIERVFYSIPHKIGYFKLKLEVHTKEEIEASRAALEKRAAGDKTVEMMAAGDENKAEAAEVNEAGSEVSAKDA